MTESGDSTTRLKPKTPSPSPLHPREPPRRRRRLRCAAWSCCAILLLVVLVVVILALTLFRPRDPSITVVSTDVSGVAPQVLLPTGRVELNITLDLDMLVHNPNRVSVSHHAGKAIIFYKGTQVADADVAPGRLPSRGSAHVYIRVILEADRFSSDPGGLAGDVLAGSLGVDSTTRIPGRIHLLGFIKHHVVATSQCHLVFGFPGVHLIERQCSNKAKL